MRPSLAARTLTALALAVCVSTVVPSGARADEAPGTGPTLLDVSIPAVNGPVDDTWLPGYTGGPRAKVLLPANYDPAKKYPLLVLLIGLTSNYHLWSDAGAGQVAKTAAGLDAIIVMPEAGNGWYTDWWNKGRRGAPSWESYLLDDVIPYTLAHFPIRPERRWHALAGVSMGGLGTAYIGGRVPGFFGSIAVISGLVDTHLILGENLVQSFIPQYARQNMLPADFDPEAVYGPELGFYSFGHDPVRLAANLRDTRVFATTGNGIPTEDGEPHTDQPTDALAEGLIIRPAMDAWVSSLRAAGVNVTSRTHNGAHSWPNFRTELRDAISWGLFAPVEENPASWVNDTVATHGTLWGTGYAFTTPPNRIVRFTRNGSTLSISAAGSPVTLTMPGGCTIVTPTPATVTPRPCAAPPAAP